MFFGDSLTAGYGLSSPQSESLPALINQRLVTSGMQYDVVNAGVSGDTTRAARLRLERYVNLDMALFILELGANDFLRGYSPPEVQQNLQYIIDKVKEKSPAVPILLLGIELPLWIANSYIDGYRKIFSNLSKQNSISLVPSFLKGVSGNRALNMIDGVHPLAAGYRVAADNIWPTIKQMLPGNPSDIISSAG